MADDQSGSPGRTLSARLPVFPWDRLTQATTVARSHVGGAVDLSVGTPVDPVPDVIQRALADAANRPGYPATIGTSELRSAASEWMSRRLGVVAAADHVLPVLGSKELVALLPTLLGLSSTDLVVVPELAYPTYDIGARLVGAEVVAADSLVSLGPRRPSLLWLNSPSNPSGRVLPRQHMRKVVDWARERGCVVVSDECYIELGWNEQPTSLLHPEVCGGSFDGLLAFHSLSKRSNLAGYRAAFAVGDARLIAELVAVRKHMGMMMPGPIQAAMAVALADDDHVLVQRQRYSARRDQLIAAVTQAGFRIDDSVAGLYLWASRDEPCWESVDWFAQRGVVVAPGDFYGTAGGRHVRIALTATDDDVVTAVRRITGI